MIDPIIGVHPDAFTRALKTEADAQGYDNPVRGMRLCEAVTVQHTTDAHFTGYGWDEVDDRVRLTKSAPFTTAHPPKLYVIGVEYDNPDHAKWLDLPDPAAAYQEFLDKLQAVFEAAPATARFRHFYFTRGGARLLYVVEDPKLAWDTEPYIRGLVHEFSANGLDMDAQVDWTRLWRLPNVLRDGEALTTDVTTQADVSLSLADLTPRGQAQKPAPTSEAAPLAASQPSPEEAKGMLHARSPVSGNLVETAFYRRAKAAMKNTEAAGVLFDGDELAVLGNRETLLMRYIGQVMNRLMGKQGTTAAHVYALFVPVVEVLIPDAGTPDWYAKAWHMVTTLWAKLEGQRKAEAESKEDLYTSIRAGIESWVDDPTFEMDADSWIERHMILTHSNRHFLIGPDGTYLKDSVSKESLIAEIRHRGLDKIIPIDKGVSPDGRVAWRSAQDILNEHSRVIHEVQMHCSGSAGYLEGDTLRVPICRRSPKLTPEYNQDVDDWLHALFDNAYDLGTYWIANALSFDVGPICALSMNASPGIGKQLLVTGLSECLERPAFATGDDLVRDFQTGLTKSVFLWVDEGWPHTKSDPADMFRTIVGGGAIPVNQKFKDLVTVYNPARVILTANNDVVYRRLLDFRNGSTSADREAMQARILHMNVGAKAERHLKQRGGFKHTRGWVASVSGGKSDFVLARHFLWLHEQMGHKEAPAARFLMTGSGTANHTASTNGVEVVSLLTDKFNTDFEKDIGEALIMLHERSIQSNGVSCDGKYVWCTPYALSHLCTTNEQMRAKFPQQPATAKFKRQLEGLSDTTKEKDDKMWYGIPVSALLQLAKTHGIASPKLMSTVSGSDIHDKITEATR